jgi:uncharacterized lipoprotein YehR (DUF1307 family)
MKETEIMNGCTEEAVEDLKYKINVGLAEAQKWTDYTYQGMQYIKQKSNNEVSFSNINRTFPYLKDTE